GTEAYVDREQATGGCHFVHQASMRNEDAFGESCRARRVDAVGAMVRIGSVDRLAVWLGLDITPVAIDAPRAFRNGGHPLRQVSLRDHQRRLAVANHEGETISGIGWVQR